MAAAARFTGGGGSPVAGGEGEAAAGLLHPLAHPRAATASGGDGGDGAAAPSGVRPAAAPPSFHAATALRSTRDHERGGKRKRATRWSYL
jgi:Domain of unknown function (DUF834).